jgi:hypothetical protein
MRVPVYILLLLTLIVPSVVRADQAGSARSTAPRMVVALQVAPRTVGALGARAETVSADPATLCETALTTAEYIGRLPPRLLGAIGVTESGRTDPGSGRLRPWPWTINAEGEGRFFETKQEAVAAVMKLQARGVRSIDVGCVQVNLMFHPDAFASLDEAFDPRVNARYAAGFLNVLYAEGKDWAHAIAAYHSETPVLGDAYRVLVMARWQSGDLHADPVAGSAYRDFVHEDRVYGAFAPRSQVYGAFAPR